MFQSRRRSLMPMMNGLMAIASVTSIAAIAIAPQSAQASSLTTVNLDFDQDADGNPLAAGDGSIQYDEAFRGNGVVITTENAQNNPLNLFNSNCGPDSASHPWCSGGDPDLATGPTYGTDPQGNVLIIQELNNDSRNPVTRPDDSAKGGSFVFDFVGDDTYEANVFVRWLDLLDVDNRVEQEALAFQFWYEDSSTEIYTKSGGGGSTLFDMTLLSTAVEENSLRRYSFAQGGVATKQVSKFSVHLGSSGAIANVKYDRITEGVPEPGTAMAVLAVGGLGLLRRKSRRVS
jgi:hypothetical protein